MKDVFFIKENIPVKVIKSKRKTISIQIKQDGNVIVRAPQGMLLRQIKAFVREKEDWILKHVGNAKLQENSRRETAQYAEEDIAALTKKAKKVIPERVAYYASMVGVSYGRIAIRCQKTRWGSCSTKGNLNFNCLLMDMPKEILDYVIVHELCHRLEMNHSARFWAQVERVLPDYKARRKWLKEHGSEYQAVSR